jgi:glycosyltransferase involved in cell wall biosynthesis
MIGKYPPIEGGVSMHLYWCAHSLAALGHQVHVVTNAKEVEPPFRMLMRHEDWLLSEGNYPRGGLVRVHWSDVPDHRQRHIPWHNPFVTKLASIAAEVINQHDLQVVFSYYIEPYGIAGHLAAQMTGRPHVVKHAGSDVGHLRPHPQFGPLYDHVFRTAQRVITGGTVAQELKAAGLPEENLFLRDDFRIPETVFSPGGETLDLTQVFREIAEDPVFAPMSRATVLPPPPYLGIYGKLGEAKGTFDLLQAVKLLRDRGQSVTLIVIGRSFVQSEARFHETLAQLNLNDCVVQLPFLPNWRIPQFIRLCRAVCFLERDFPIKFHAPTVPREVLACGKCLVASAEILQRQLFSERLIHGFNCLAARDVRNIDELASVLSAALELPERAEEIGRRGHQYSLETEPLRDFPRNYEILFSEVIEERNATSRPNPSNDRTTDEFSWTRQVVDSLPDGKRDDVLQFAMQYGSGPAWALAVYARLLQLVEKDELGSGCLLEGVRLELQLSGVLTDERGSKTGSESSLFRLEAEGDIILDRDLPSLYAEVAHGLKIETYNCDVGQLLDARNRGELPLWVSQRPSHAAILPNSEGSRSRVISLSPAMCYLLSLCDGTRSVAELVADIATGTPSSMGIDHKISQAIIDCFRLGLVRLIARPRLDPASMAQKTEIQS